MLSEIKEKGLRVLTLKKSSLMYNDAGFPRQKRYADL
jgi:hypothetical protein